jgi:transcriptional regulator with XRE-family HTH domain
MGRKSRPAPSRLGEKLKAVRNHLDISQGKMLALVKPGAHKDHRSMISEYEHGTKAPDYETLLCYARLVNVSTDVLIDDALELTFLKDEQSPEPDYSSPAASELEPLIIHVPAKLLDIIDNVYLDLLRGTPRASRAKLSREFYYRALFVTSIRDHLNYADRDILMESWWRLISRNPADLETKPTETMLL